MALKDLVIRSGNKSKPDPLLKLKARLRKMTYRFPNGRSVHQLRNPDGPEAATVIELLQQQVELAKAMETGTAKTAGLGAKHDSAARQGLPETSLTTLPKDRG